jgi:membrane fusion protein (multidrug efflux system)
VAASLQPTGTTPVTPPAPPEPRAWGKVAPLVGKAVLALVLALGLGVLLLFLAGVFHPKVPPGEGAPAATTDRPTVAVLLVRRPRFETAVGTVRAVHEAAVASKLLARVTEVHVKAGQPVTRDEVLVRLDDSDLQARWKQAQAAVASAAAAKQGAEADHARAVRLFPGGGIAKEELDRRATAVRTTTSELDRAQEAAREAQVLLAYATVRSPMTGIVIDKRVEVGDTATPGQVLLTLYDPGRMQMVATVRESLALRLKVGQKVPARIDTLHHDCQATISEIVPEAQAASRSFTVKVTGPCPPGVYSGMFGRIFIPLDDEQVAIVPAAAVLRVGQLDLVEVVGDDGVRRRVVQLGRRLEQGYEVLAGLRPGERVVVQEGSTAPEGRP